MIRLVALAWATRAVVILKGWEVLPAEVALAAGRSDLLQDCLDQADPARRASVVSDVRHLWGVIPHGPGRIAFRTRHLMPLASKAAVKPRSDISKLRGSPSSGDTVTFAAFPLLSASMISPVRGCTASQTCCVQVR